MLSFESLGSKHDVYRGKDFMKKVFKSLREHAMKIISIKKKEKEVINKRGAGIIWSSKNLIYLSRKIWK